MKIESRIQDKLVSETDLARLYHDNTCLTSSTIGEFLHAMNVSENIAHPKQYPAFPSIAMKPAQPGFMRRLRHSLWSVLRKRATDRKFKPVASAKISQLLLGSLQPGSMRDDGLRQRPYPSAGGLYGVNVFLLNRSVMGLKPGVFNVNADRQCFEQIQLFDNTHEISTLLESAIVGDESIYKASAYFVLAGNLDAVKIKYGDRGYRFLLLEAGHIAQNISLVATALNMAHVPLGGFCEKEIESLIGDPDMMALYLIAVG